MAQAQSPLHPQLNTGQITNSPTHLGHHILAEFYDCDPNVLNNVERIEEHMVGGAKACGATVIGSHFHHFSPYGVSGVVIISESHLAIHTWPEYGYAAVDLFTCGTECDPKVAYEYLKNTMNAGSAHYTELSRGLMQPGATGALQMMQLPFQIQHEQDDRPPHHRHHQNEDVSHGLHQTTQHISTQAAHSHLAAPKPTPKPTPAPQAAKTL